MIEIKNLHKAFGQNQVLKGVDITVNKGDVVVVIGPSGSGKTTMLRCINFLERADEGTITVGDITVDAAKAKKKEIHEIRLRTAMVFQNYNLFANKTALGNVMEGLTQARGVSKEKAKEIALSLELFTTGSLDAFAHETNVDTQNRIVIYDIMDLGRQLKTMGLLIITDAMLNRVTENWRKGKRTHLFIDEFHVVFQNPYSADFFDSAWRRFRKRGAYPTAITQNVEYLLDSVQASTMLSNSEMLILLNQAPSDREKLAALLNISPEQTGYITNAPAGCGLLRYGGALVPFKNQFPKDTELYRLMTTKPDESIIVGGKTK